MKEKVQELLKELSPSQVELVLNFVKDIVASHGHNLPLNVLRDIDEEIGILETMKTNTVEVKVAVEQELIVYDGDYYNTQHNGLFIKIHDFNSLEGNSSKTFHLYTKGEKGYVATEYFDVTKKSEFEIHFSARTMLAPPTSAHLETQDKK